MKSSREQVRIYFRDRGSGIYCVLVLEEVFNLGCFYGRILVEILGIYLIFVIFF